MASAFLFSLAGLTLPAVQGQAQSYSYVTIAGIGGKAGFLEGAGGGIGFPLFNAITGVAVNSAGTIYVTDAGNQLIRTITSAGVVTTFAGTVGQNGIADGTGISASFYSPQGPAVDSAGNIYIADFSSSTIRKITSAGVVTTLAGTALSAGSVDGTGAAARFNKPSAVAVDASGNVYVADSGNNTIRKITSAGVVTTLAGTAGVAGKVNGTGTAATFSYPRGIAVDSDGVIYVADANNNTIRKITSAGEVSTFAGTADTFGSTDGTGSAARFSFPNSIAVDSAKNLYVADELNHLVRKITPAGVVTTLAGTAGVAGKVDGTGTAAKFNSPAGVTVDSAGNVFVADYNNELIRKITSSGVVTTLAGVASMAGALDGVGYNLSPALLNGPSATAVNAAAGIVYVADTGNNVIRSVTSAGVVSVFAGNNLAVGRVDGVGKAASFNAPGGLTIDNAGNLYVADTSNHLIRKVTPAGAVSTIAGTGGTAGSADGAGTSATFNLPSAAAVDASGNVFVADYGNNLIRKITAAGVVTTVAGQAGVSGSADGVGGAATFNRPRGIAVDASGFIYVADSGNQTIRRISSGGLVQTFAGATGVTGTADGTTGAVARFNGPTGVAVDGAGNIFVADSNNSTIRMITPAGAVTTVGGAAGVASNVDGAAATARFDHPAGLAADASGVIYIADTRNHTIRKGTTSTSGSGAGGDGTAGGSTGGTSGGAGSGGTGGNGGTGGTGGGTGVGTGFLLRPVGMALSPSGGFYIADTANNCIKAVAVDNTVTVLAGKEGSAGSADGTGTAALFNGPTGVVSDSAGTVYVCDTGNGTIRKITSAGVVTTIAGAAGSRGSTDGTGSAALFSSPTGIALDTAGNLFVSDSANSTIRKITSAGVVTTFAGAAKVTGDVDGTGTVARFNNPTGLVMSSSNVLFIADTYNHTIRRLVVSPVIATIEAVGTVTTAGNVIVTVTDAGLTGSPVAVSVPVVVDDTAISWASKAATALQANTAIAARYVASSSSSTIRLTGITADASDTTLKMAITGSAATGITDSPTSTLVLSGGVTTLAGSAGISGAFDGSGAFALFNLPAGLALDSSSNIYVADTGNSAIRRVRSDGVVTTVAGIAGISGNRDGTNTQALFNQPQGIVLSGSVLVADTGNSVVRAINSQFSVSTIALKAPTTSGGSSSGGSSSGGGGGGSTEPWVVGSLAALAALDFARRRRARVARG